MIKKRLVILAAGQFGRAAAGLLSTDHYELLAFADNNSALWGSFYPHPLGSRIPILSVAEALALQPDTVLTGVIDPVRTRELIDQLGLLGYSGEILTLSSDYEHLDIRSATLLRLAARLTGQKIPGACAELGVYKGDLAWKINALFPDRKLYLFDTFTGFDGRDVATEEALQCSRAREGDFQDTSISFVKSRLPYPDRAIFCPGFFPGTAASVPEETYAFVSLDADLYAPILAGLEYFYPRLAKGGMILLHDYLNERFRGAKRAVEEYEKRNGAMTLVPLCDLHGSAVIVK